MSSRMLSVPHPEARFPLCRPLWWRKRWRRQGRLSMRSTDPGLALAEWAVRPSSALRCVREKGLGEASSSCCGVSALLTSQLSLVQLGTPPTSRSFSWVGFVGPGFASGLLFSVKTIVKLQLIICDLVLSITDL